MILLAIASGALALGAPLRASQDNRQDSTARPAQSENPARPTAEDILRELRNREPGRDVIPPASWEGKGAPPDRPKLLPEGTPVIGISGQLQREGEWWVFVFDKSAVKEQHGFEAGTDRIKVLPNSALEGLVRMTRGSPSPQIFEINAEAAVYRGENYLLIRSAARAKPTAGLSEAGSLRSDSRLAPPEAEPKLGAQPPQNSAGSRAVAADASAEDVLERMKQLSPTNANLSPEPVATGSADDEFSAISAPIFEGTPVIRRTGRLIPQGEGWAFAFDTDHTQQAEQPLRLLPNQSLQFMVEQHERSPAGLVFTVSGEVTEFGGRNYLLARAVTRRLDLGNLRR